MVYSSWCDSLHFVAVGDDPEDEAGSQHYNLQLNPRDHNFCIFSVSFSDDSREILGGANDGCLYVYDRGVAKQTSRIQEEWLIGFSTEQNSCLKRWEPW